MPERDYKTLMREAIIFARKGRFHTYPNPSVGAVLARDGKILAHGWHHGAGLPHAEIDCLINAKENNVEIQGATMAVTLEPCVHHGKTPPCVDTLLQSGIARLIYGTEDPNPEARGGAKKMAEAGIEVIGPVLEQECKDLIADFTIWQTTSRPYIILKLAATLDGKIATRNGHSRWISSQTSRDLVHDIRADIGAAGGAILIGGGTFRQDNPQLTTRTGAQAGVRQPLACVITSRLPRVDSDFHLLRERPGETIFFASPAATASAAAEALRKIGCRIFPLGPDRTGAPDFQGLFKTLREDLGCPYVFCEGGGRLALSLLESGYIDEFHLHLAPLILGDSNARPLFNGLAPLSIEEALQMRFCDASIYGNDAHLLLRPVQTGKKVN